MKDNIDVLFYKNENDYAVKLLTKENEDVILYRTDKNNSFENLYSYVENNTTFDSFENTDSIKIPFINIDETISYNELCNKKIKDSSYIISQALQTIKLEMDNKGGKLKSEAAIVMMKAALPVMKNPRNFFFDKPFVMFLKEESKNKPYFAMRVSDTKYLVKENKE